MILRVLHTLLVAAVISWALAAPLAWALRDGLGPETEPTSGVEAVQRFVMTFSWGPILLLLLILWALVRYRLATT